MNVPAAPTQRHGFSLLELLLVLIVMASIAFMAINRYQLYEHEKDILAVKQNVNLLFNAANAYYHICCSATNGVKSGCTSCANNQFCINISALKNYQKGLLMPNLIESKLAELGDYRVSAKYLGQTLDTKKPIYQLSIITTLNIPLGFNNNTIDWYQNILGASRIFPGPKQNQLAWDKLPSYSVPTTTSSLWIASSGLRQFKEVMTMQQATGDDTCAY